MPVFRTLGPRRKLRSSRAHSRSLESLTTALAAYTQQSGNTEQSHRAKRRSCDMAKDKAAHRSQDSKNIKTGALGNTSPTQSLQEATGTGVKRESFRMATELNRVEPGQMDPEIRHSYRKQQSAPGSLLQYSESRRSDPGDPERSVSREMIVEEEQGEGADSDCAAVVFTDIGPVTESRQGEGEQKTYQLGASTASSQSSLLTTPPTPVVWSDLPSIPSQSRVIANQHAKSIDCLDTAETAGGSQADTTSSHCERLNSTAKSDKPKGNNRISTYENWNGEEQDPAEVSNCAGGRMSNIASECNRAPYHGEIATSISNLTASQAQLSPSSPAVKDNVYIGDARPLQTDIATSRDRIDPWIPRDNGHGSSRPQRDSLRSNKSNQSKSRDRLKFNPFAKLTKSQSFTSSDDLNKKCEEKGQGTRRKPRSHRRLPSDTLVFANRTAFVASPCSPRMLRLNPELQRRLARLATPPRDMGPDHLLQEIEASRERGRVITRYGTPPRSSLETAELSPDEEPEGAIFINKMHYGIEYERGLLGQEADSRVRMDCSGGCLGSYTLVDASMPSVSSAGVEAGMTSPDRNSTVISNPASPCHMVALCDMEADLQELLKQESRDSQPGTPKFPLHIADCPAALPARPGSFHGRTVHSTMCSNSTKKQTVVGSPTSPSSAEGIMDSLKHALTNFTSKFRLKSPTGSHTRSLECSPTRPTTRARSADDMHRIDHNVHLVTEPSPKPEKDGHKEKKHRFVYQLARVYSDRSKRRPAIFRRSKSRDGRDSNPGTPVLVSPGRQPQTETDKGSKTDSASGSKPLVLGAYQLQRHRPPRPSRKRATNAGNGEPKEEGSVTGSAACPQVDTGDTNQCDTRHSPTSVPFNTDHTNGEEAVSGNSMDTKPPKPTHLPLSQCNGHMEDTTNSNCDSAEWNCYINKRLSSSVSDINIELADPDEACNPPTPPDFYYEERLMKDLEEGSIASSFNGLDSAVPDAECEISGVDTQPSPFLKMSIRQTVRLIEQKCRAKQVSRIEIKRGEKARGIQDILKHLESRTSSRGTTPDGTGTGSMEGGLNTEPSPIKSVRERTRELVECATLTRIRQNSCTVDPEYKMPLGEEEPPEPISPTRRGYVRQIVAMIQGVRHVGSPATDEADESEC